MSRDVRNGQKSTTGGRSTSESIQSWLDVIAKLIGALAIAGVTFLAATYQSQESLSTLINEREQAESQLRASMLSDLVGPIIGKDGALSDDTADLKRQRLLAEMVTLNFHDHFEFKPLLEEVDAKLLAHDPAGHEKIASVARRVVDRQINMLTAIDGVTRAGRAGYGAKSTRVDLWKRGTSVPDRCTTESQLGDLGKQGKKLTIPALVCLSSPDKKVCLLLALYWDGQKKAVTMSPLVYPNRSGSSDCYPQQETVATGVDRAQQLEEASLSIFDFPLTDNTKVIVPFTERTSFPFSLAGWQRRENDVEYRFSVSLYQFTSADNPITLKVLWFPEGYVTERERPPPRNIR